MDQLEVHSIGSNERRTMRSCGEGDQDIEVKIAQFLWTESVIEAHFREDLSGLKPVCFGGSEDSMPLFEGLNQNCL